MTTADDDARLAAAWAEVDDALAAAHRAVVEDPDPRNARETADGHRYLFHMMSAISQNAVLPADPDRPSFRPMIEATRHLGAAGKDIDYDVALVRGGRPHRITGHRGDATFVGVCVYDAGGAGGATALLASVDLDDLELGPDGSFVLDLGGDDPGPGANWIPLPADAGSLIVRQYFHDRAAQRAGSWTIERRDGDVPAATLPTPASVTAHVHNVARQIRWNAGLNRLWGAEERARPNRFVRQSAAEIVAAIPNPDVVYAMGWWRLADDEALVVHHVPPAGCRWWSLQVLDRWFQCAPDRLAHRNDREVTPNADGSVDLVLGAVDPGHPNWLDVGGHTVGTMFFRWLQAEPAELPTCTVVPVASLGVQD